MIKLIGIPFDANSSFLKGPALAPARIRMMEAEGSANCYAENGIEIKAGINYDDYGDIVFDSTNAADGFALIQQTIAAQLKDDDKIISLGGDHSVSYPLIDAFTKVHNKLHVHIWMRMQICMKILMTIPIPMRHHLQGYWSRGKLHRLHRWVFVRLIRINASRPNDMAYKW